MRKFFKLKARWYLVMFFLMLAVDVLLCVYTFYSSNKTLNTILLVVSFLLTGAIFDMFISRIFDAKRRKAMYKEKVYILSSVDDLSKKFEGYTKRAMSFGEQYSIVDGITLKKITIIKDVVAYHNYEPNDKDAEATPGINKAKNMVGIELFLDWDNVLLESIPNYTISTGKIMYTAMYLKDGKLIEANHQEVLKPLENSYNELLALVGIKESM